MSQPQLTVEDLIEAIRSIAYEDIDAIGDLSAGAVTDAVTLVNERLPPNVPPIATKWADDGPLTDTLEDDDDGE
jgi:hypothetical protein